MARKAKEESVVVKQEKRETTKAATPNSNYKFTGLNRKASMDTLSKRGITKAAFIALAKESGIHNIRYSGKQRAFFW